MREVRLDSGDYISVDPGRRGEKPRVALSVPWKHVLLTTDQTYNLIRALLDEARAAVEKDR